MVATEACSRATCDSSAIVTLSRKRRCTRVLTVRRNHVAVADTPRPIADTITSPDRCSSTPLPSSANHTAMSASGNAESCDSTKATSMRRGSWRYPSLHSRHIDDSIGGSRSKRVSGAGTAVSAKDVIRRSIFVFSGVETLRLQFEHRSIAPALRHQLVVRTELDDASVLEHADPIGVTHRRKAMRNQNRRRVPRRREDAIEDLHLAAHIELRGGFV